MLTFDPERHEYHWQGELVPNVTRILAAESPYSRFSQEALEPARIKGVHVHQMIAYDCRGELDEDTLPEWMQPALVEWRRFVRESGFKPHLSECQVYSGTFRYAGTLDLLGTLPGGMHALIDIKRSFLGGPTIGLQTAAYVIAGEADPYVGEKWPRRTRMRRFALRIREDARYQIKPYDDASDYPTFLAALTLYRWRQRNAE